MNKAIKNILDKLPKDYYGDVKSTQFDWSTWAEEFRKDMKKAQEKINPQKVNKFPQFIYVTNSEMWDGIHGEANLEFIKDAEEVAVYVLEDIKKLRVIRELL